MCVVSAVLVVLVVSRAVFYCLEYTDSVDLYIRGPPVCTPIWCTRLEGFFLVVTLEGVPLGSLQFGRLHLGGSSWEATVGRLQFGRLQFGRLQLGGHSWEATVGRLQVGRLQFGRLRSEEHTSELQPQPDLVCRTLLEKKKFL